MRSSPGLRRSGPLGLSLYGTPRCLSLDRARVRLRSHPRTPHGSLEGLPELRKRRGSGRPLMAEEPESTGRDRSGIYPESHATVLCFFRTGRRMDKKTPAGPFDGAARGTTPLIGNERNTGVLKTKYIAPVDKAKEARHRAPSARVRRAVFWSATRPRRPLPVPQPRRGRSFPKSC